MPTTSTDPYEWIDENYYETFGWLIVPGMPETDVINILSQGTATPVEQDHAWEHPAAFATRTLPTGHVLVWDDAYFGLRPAIARRLSTHGRYIAIAWGMTQRAFTIADHGTLTRSFDPLIRHDPQPGDDDYDPDDNPEQARTGTPLPDENNVDWHTSPRTASLNLAHLLTGVTIHADPWDDPAYHWYGCHELNEWE